MANDGPLVDGCTCGGCGAARSPAGEDGYRSACSCGDSRITYHRAVEDHLELREGVGWKLKRAGRSGWQQEAQDLPEFQREEGKWGRLSRHIDRESDWYFERITLEDGTVLHHSEHPLSQHQGHGNDRGARTSPGPQITRE